MPLAFGVGIKSIAIPPDKTLPQRTTEKFQNYILFEQFQIELPLDRFGIILRAIWHRTGGCQPIPNSEMLP